MGVDLRLVLYARGREAEALHRPIEIGLPFGLAERQPFADRRLVDLDDADAGGLQVRHLVAQRERDLAADVRRAARSSRTKDHCSMVTGPVSMPFIGRLVSDCA